MNPETVFFIALFVVILFIGSLIMAVLEYLDDNF